MANKTTSPKVASDASKLLTNPKSSPKVKEVAGSALSQTPSKKHK
ncbi:MAG: hypothetical protein ABSE58_07475 [Candidatus Limnocylindrales bacterium]|jgi:hypothetical protein